MIQSSTEQKREPGTDWVYVHIYGTWLSQKCDWRPWSRITVRRSVGLTCCFIVYFYKKLEHLAAVVFLPLLQSIMSAALGGPLWANSPLSGCRKLMHFFHRAVFCQAMNCTCSLGVQQVPQCKVRSVSVHSEGNRGLWKQSNVCLLKLCSSNVWPSLMKATGAYALHSVCWLAS